MQVWHVQQHTQWHQSIQAIHLRMLEQHSPLHRRGLPAMLRVHGEHVHLKHHHIMHVPCIRICHMVHGNCNPFICMVTYQKQGLHAALLASPRMWSGFDNMLCCCQHLYSPQDLDPPILVAPCLPPPLSWSLSVWPVHSQDEVWTTSEFAA